ncbi:MAG: restriction endonuclease [Candidatus Aminicenantes bacterium RBG_16_63_14]|nr:MAG: restriction endonuclease [Candidatus Aminicenantes bacterium RBG_16_63_14]OGD26226.1 MAG: restriction endonuclease [Candidatus Aminicenantes bacterium RBG_19FT_COMBO_65_30]
MKKATLVTGEEYIDGAIDEIVFYNPDNGYTVCKFLPETGETLTIVGCFPPLTPGEVLRIRGVWEINPRFGRQFKVDHFTLTLPASAKGIEKFLASGLVKGIGPVLAKRIVGTFGAGTIEILTRKPERLREVEGVGAVKLREIRRSWAEHQDIRDLIMFLQEHNVSTSLATKIYRQYGDRSFTVLKTNPYQLSLEIWGVGFKTADQIALKLGMDPASLERVKAYILYILEKDNEQGHVFSLASEVGERCAADLDVPAVKVELALAGLLKGEKIVAEDWAGGRALYLPFFYQAQEEVVRSIHKLAGFPCRAPDFDLGKAIADTEKELGMVFSPLQRGAIRESFERKILVITGGPGTGKTTIIRAVVDIFRKWGKEVLLAAPTGRAAKRLLETTGQDARTIHRVLEFQPKKGTFKRNEGNPLRGEALVVDEFSMVDLPLMYHLLKAVPPWMRLILVGDKDQLPSVGPGALLHDIIASGTVDVVRLDEIFRQEKESLIVVNAHRVNQGLSLVYAPRTDKNADFYFIRQEDDKKAFQTILKMCSSSIPYKLGLSPLSPQIQVISPMYKGVVGVDNLNTELQTRLNPGREGLQVGSRVFRARDKVMQVRNDYDKDVFNGDIGSVLHADKAKYRLFVDFDGRTVCYEKDELNDITLAYAVSVHKAQGSEYQAVIMPLLTQHFIMLQRNLFYTALTRAKKLSVVIGSYKALYIAIKNDKPVKRNSLVKDKLVRLGAA